jgi:signal transduction histidine kinase/DNA-binding response OmpR family regulator
MATILIVDDHPTNRDFLMTLLGYGGHRLLEAGDGQEGLSLARSERPDLIIADILMPTMDGYQFAHQVRADPAIADIEIIFYTATYLEAEARELARACGVGYLITKPADPQVILDTVAAALGSVAPVAPSINPESFDREHLKLLTSKLVEKVNELEAVNQRLAALIELGQQLATEYDTIRLLQQYCDGARQIIGARYAFAALLNEQSQFEHILSSGVDKAGAARLNLLPAGADLFARLLADRRPLRLGPGNAGAEITGLPPHHPAIRSLVAVPIASPTHLYGVLYLGDKIGINLFDQEDERILVTLAAQMSVAYENARRHSKIQQHATLLQQEITERKQVELALRQAEQQAKRFNAELERRVAARTSQLEATNNEMKSFAYSVSHDLRAPLRAISGFTDILMEESEAELNEDSRHYLQRIRAAARRMDQLIEDILKLSHVSRDDIHATAVNLGNLAQAIVAELQQRDPDRVVAVTIDKNCVAQADSRLLQIALENLLENAWKFTGTTTDAKVEFGCSVAPSGELVYYVRDNGVGFDAAYSDKLFGVFQRLHAEDKFPGTGIGLATVQRIVHRHGGRIWAEAAVDQGATFFFTLPAVPIRES